MEPACFQICPREIRDIIWQFALLNTTKRTIHLESGFKPSRNNPNRDKMSDNSRILAIRQSCKEANEAFLFSRRQNMITMSPELSIPLPSPLSQPVLGSTSGFNLSIYYDSVCLDKKLVRSRVRQAEGPVAEYTAAPWSQEPPHRRPRRFIMDLDACLDCIGRDRWDYAWPEHCRNKVKVMKFLLALGFIPAAATNSNARLAVTKYNLEAWRSQGITDKTAITIYVPRDDDDKVSDLDVTKGPALMAWNYNTDVGKRWRHEKHLASIHKQRAQLNACLNSWEMMVQTARRVGIAFPFELNILRRPTFGPAPYHVKDYIIKRQNDLEE